MEEVIAAGRVSVNGQIAQVGERIEPGDELRIDGRKVQFQIEDEIRRRVLIYYKPEGEICSRNDPEQRPTVFDHLPQIANDRWVMVGRLDINSTGLLLFTNDGELANRLMHPSNEIEREYAVRVMGEVTPQIRQTLLNGVVLDDGPAKFESFLSLVVTESTVGIRWWLKKAVTAKFVVCSNLKGLKSAACFVPATVQLFYRVNCVLAAGWNSTKAISIA